jgi:uncharacterized protein (TIGR03437 family)
MKVFALLFSLAAAAAAQTCNITLSSYSVNVPVAGGMYGPITVTASASSCERGAVTSVSWIHINYGNAGTGNGTFGFTVDPNPLAATRTGTITAGNAAFTVFQAGLPCNLSLPVTSLQVPAGGGSFNFAVNAANGCAWTASSTVSWITMTSGAAGTGSGSVGFSVSANNAPARNGAIQVSAGSSQLTFGVSQQSGCGVAISPTSASVSASGGSGTIQVTAPSQCSWTVTSNAAWIQAMAGPASVSYTVAANPSAGARTGTITVTSQTFTVTQSGAMQLTAVVNAASYAQGGVSPGEIVTLYGALLGPATLTTAQLTSGQQSFPKSLAGTTVLFDTTPAPIIYTVAGQVSAIVPYEVAGQTITNVQVQYQGNSSGTLSLAVVPAAPGIFTINAAGTGQGAILNQDGSTVNGPATPAAKGSVISIFATGEGQTVPAASDGFLTPLAPPFPQPQLKVSVAIGGVNAGVLYAGAAPGLVAGLLQVNAQIPDSVAGGPAVPILLTIGNTRSQTQVTAAVAP